MGLFGQGDFRIRILVVIALILAVCPFVYLGGRHYVRNRGLVRAREKIQIGDSKQTVVALMGSPDRIEKCDDLYTSSSPDQRKLKEHFSPWDSYSRFA